MDSSHFDCKIVNSIYMCTVLILDIIDIRVEARSSTDGHSKPESIVSGRNQRAGNEFASSSGLSVCNYRADTANRVIQLLSDASPEAVVGYK